MSVVDLNVQPHQRRLFADSLADIALGLLELVANNQRRSVRVELRLPIELGFNPATGELTGDLPLYRRATAFDAPPTEVTLILETVTL